jgi:hypothetical protein
VDILSLEDGLFNLRLESPFYTKPAGISTIFGMCTGNFVPAYCFSNAKNTLSPKYQNNLLFKEWIYPWQVLWRLCYPGEPRKGKNLFEEPTFPKPKTARLPRRDGSRTRTKEYVFFQRKKEREWDEREGKEKEESVGMEKEGSGKAELLLMPNLEIFAIHINSDLTEKETCYSQARSRFNLGIFLLFPFFCVAHFISRR